MHLSRPRGDLTVAQFTIPIPITEKFHPSFFFWFALSFSKLPHFHKTTLHFLCHFFWAVAVAALHFCEHVMTSSYEISNRLIPPSMSLWDNYWKWGDRPCSRGTNLDVCYFLWNINCSLLPCLTETGIGSRRTPTGLLRLWQGVGGETGVGWDIRTHHREQPGQSSNILCREEWLEVGDTPFDYFLLLVSTFFISLLRGYQNQTGQSLELSRRSFLYLFLLSLNFPIFVTHFSVNFVFSLCWRVHYISCIDNIWKAL